MYAKIKAARMKAMKEKNQLAKDLYSTFLGEIDRVSNKDSDMEVLVKAVAKKMAKDLEKSINDYSEHGVDTSKAKAELAIISEYLEKVLSEEDTEELITSVIDSMLVPNIGKVMGALKKNYGTSVDMKMASDIAKRVLNGG